MAMSKRKFCAILAETALKLNIPRGNMIIFAGGASLLLELRDSTNDIDVMMFDLDRSIYNRLVVDGHIPKRYEQTGLTCGADVISYNGVDLHWFDEIDASYQHKNFRGYRIPTPYQLFKDRISLGRDKDIEEMKKLNEYYNELPQYLKDRYNQLMIK